MSSASRAGAKGGSVLPDSARLALADGTVYRGRAFGARAVQDGEVVFNGAGYYRDEYTRQEGRWRIRSTCLEAEPFEV